MRRVLPSGQCPPFLAMPSTALYREERKIAPGAEEVRAMQYGREKRLPRRQLPTTQEQTMHDNPHPADTTRKSLGQRLGTWLFGPPKPVRRASRPTARPRLEALEERAL